MKVTCGAAWTANPASGNRQSYDVTLEENDGAELFGAERWQAMPWVERYKALQKRGDMLVVAYMQSVGAMTPERAAKTIESIKTR